MSHEIEQYDNGEYGFIGNRVPGWHMLGTVWPEGAPERLDLPLAMRKAHLTDWEVRLATSIIILDPKSGEAVPTDEYGITLRNNPTDPDAPAQPLGVVSNGYVPVQNEEAFQWGESLMAVAKEDGKRMEVETAGSIKGGRQTFVLFRMDDIRVDTEVVYPYFHVTTSHDGSLAVTAQLTGVRVVCANTQAMSLSQDVPRFTVRHYGDNLSDRLDEARSALGIAYEGVGTFQQAMDRWMHVPVKPAQFDKIVLARFPDPKLEDVDHPLALANRIAAREALRYLYESAATNADIRGTAWGAVQAMVEWEDWLRNKTEGTARARWQTGSVAMDARRKAFKIVEKVVGVPALAVITK